MSTNTMGTNEFNLFSFEEKTEPVLDEVSEATQEYFETLAFKYEPIKRDTTFSDNRWEVRHYNGKMRKEKAQFLKKLTPGCAVYIDGLVTAKFEIVEVDENYYVGHHLLEKDGRFVKVAQDEPNYRTDHNVNIDYVNGFEVDGVPYFFKMDPNEKLQGVSLAAFEKRFKEMDSIERHDLLVWGVYFNYSHIPLSLLESKHPLVDLKKKKPSYISNPHIGYWDKCVNLGYDFKERRYRVAFFDEEYVVEKKSLEAMYDDFALRLNAVKDGDLTGLNDFEIMAYYVLMGYRVIPDFVTSEWTFRHTDSEKVLIITREDLLNTNAMIEKWNLFSKNKKALDVTIGDRIEAAYAKNYLKAPSTALKPFVIPVGTLHQLESQYHDMTNHLTYEVVSDDGKIVTMKPSAVLGEDVAGKPMFKMPRGRFEWAYVDARALGLPLVNNQEQQYLPIPYAIPDYMECSLEQLVRNHRSFINGLPENEYQKYLVYDRLVTNGKLNRAVIEGDYELVFNKIQTTLNCVSSDYIMMIKGAMRGCNVSYGRNLSLKEVYLREPDIFATEPIVMSDFDLETMKAFNAYVGMAEAINTLPPEEWSIVELMLAYTLQNKQLRYFGTPTHFQIAENCVHSTKYNLLDVEGTIRSIFYK